MNVCPKCGAQTPGEFCTQCGTRTTAAQPVYQQPVYQQPYQPAAPATNVIIQQKAVTGVNDLPPQYRPLGAWSYFGYSLLFTIPIVGFILLIVFSFNSSNINRRSFARSHWCWAIIAGIATIIFFIIAAASGGISALLEGLK